MDVGLYYNEKLRIHYKNSLETPSGAVMRVRYAAALLAIVSLVFFEAGCGDTFRPIATPIIQPGGQPQLLAHAIVVSDAGPSADGATTHINVSGDTNVGQVAVGRVPVH